MDPFVNEISEAYKNMAAAAVAAAVALMEARVAGGGDGGEVPRTAECDAALEELKERLDLFRASCDRADGAIDEAKRRAECGLFFPAMGDGVGEADGPIAARENAVGDDDDIPGLTEMPDAGFVEAAPAVDVTITAEAEGSAARENVVMYNITQKIMDAWGR